MRAADGLGSGGQRVVEGRRFRGRTAGQSQRNGLASAPLAGRPVNVVAPSVECNAGRFWTPSAPGQSAVVVIGGRVPGTAAGSLVPLADGRLHVLWAFEAC